jgi:hypothetical protein
MATFCAKIYHNFGFNNQGVRFDAFEKQLTMTKFASNGWRRLNKAAHLLTPLFARNRRSGWRLRINRDHIAMFWRRLDRGLLRAETAPIKSPGRACLPANTASFGDFLHAARGRKVEVSG